MFGKLFSNEGRWVGGVVLAIFLFALVNVAVSTLSNYRVDLTQDQLFTLSDGTKKIIRDIKEPITLGYYFSSRLGKEIPIPAVDSQKPFGGWRGCSSSQRGKLLLQEKVWAGVAVQYHQPAY